MKNSCGEAVYHNAYLYFSQICHFCENRYRRRGEGRGGCSSNGGVVHCLDLTSHNNLFSTQTFQKSVSILCSYCSLLSGEFKAYTLLLQN